MSKFSRRQFLGLSAAFTGALVGRPLTDLRATLADDNVRQWTATGQVMPTLSAFDNAVQTFMQARNITSGALAMTRNGQLMLARGYSWSADSTMPLTFRTTC